ncbi:TIGR04255 family protein [Streptomyces sp. NPDC059850]|uniref:TIGR04255 family protein n=1 Tax=Streptomyces sp. NPDC059850 TaxID=3346970 RepID=UPI003654A558
MAGMLRFRQPPVHEVTLGLMFQPLSRLQSLDLASLRVDWRSEYPNLRESTPLTPWQPSSQDDVEFMRSGLPWPMGLCSLSTELGDRKIKFQQDRFILIWKSTGDEQPYPGYDSLKAELLGKFDHFSKLSQNICGTLPEVRRADAQYLNRLPEISAYQAMAGVLTGWSSESAFPFRAPDYCGFRVQYQQSERDDRVSVLIGVDSAVTEPSVGEFSEGSSLIIDAESQVDLGDDFALRMDAAHEVVSGAFVEATSAQMRQQWGEMK